jgi:3'(2'), 5'-bisphosphate nucleotidase
MRENLERELNAARTLARSAGAGALQFYGKNTLHIAQKGDMNEPVTEADFAANAILVNGLRAEFPADALLSEELPDDPQRLARERVWIVDPLDGTKGFIAGNGDFAVQIGLAVRGEPALGVVYLPATDVLYWAARGAGAWVERADKDGQIKTEELRVSDEDDLTRVRLAVSRSHRSPRMNRVVETLGVREEIARGSVGIKIGLIVERQCALYVHLSSHTKHWDTCAPEIIMREAGGCLTDLWGAKIRYNTADVRNYNGLVASNLRLHKTVIAKLAPLLQEFGRQRI